MADFSLEDLAVPVAAASPNFAVKVAAGALVFGCGLYRDYPGAIVGTTPNAFTRGLMDTLCDDRVPLPPPPTEFSPRGECDNELYSCVLQFNTRFPSDSTVQQAFQVWGRIGNFVSFNNANSTAEIIWQSRGLKSQFTTPQTFGDRRLFSSSQYRIKETNPGIQIVSLTRINGQPDTCGGTIRTYPPTTIPPERLTGNITNVYNDGTDFNIPVVYAPVDLSAPFTLNVGGLDFKFDFGGLTIGGGGDADLTPVLLRLDKLDADLTIVKGDIDTVKDDIDRVREDTIKIKKSVDKPPPKPGSEDYDEDVKPPGADPEESGIEALSYVQLELTSIPQNAKNQSGNGSPTIYYAGWFEFRTGVYAYPREPIHFEFNLFEAPTGSDGYAYCLYVGYQGQVTVFKHKNDEPA